MAPKRGPVRQRLGAGRVKFIALLAKRLALVGETRQMHASVHAAAQGNKVADRKLMSIGLDLIGKRRTPCLEVLSRFSM